MMLPWHQASWQSLIDRHQRHGLPHALLLAGASGTGKRQFASQLAAYLLCQNPAKDDLKAACGNCHSCQLMQAGSHPDLIIAEPEDKSRQIRIDSVRRVNDFLAQTPQISRAQVVIVQPLDVLNTNAANALLKTLEEPAGESYLLLLGERIGAVMPTIRSRCQLLPLPLPTHIDAVQWLSQSMTSTASESVLHLALRLSHGAPLQAQAYLNDGRIDALQTWLDQLQQWSRRIIPLQTLVDAWNKHEFQDVINWWLLALTDLLKVASGADGDHCVFNLDVYLGSDFAASVTSQDGLMSSALASHYDALIALQREIYMVNGGLQQGLSHFNQNLLTESWLLKWRSIFNS